MAKGAGGGAGASGGRAGGAALAAQTLDLPAELVRANPGLATRLQNGEFETTGGGLAVRPFDRTVDRINGRGDRIVERVAARPTPAALREAVSVARERRAVATAAGAVRGGKPPAVGVLQRGMADIRNEQQAIRQRLNAATVGTGERRELQGYQRELANEARQMRQQAARLRRG